MWFIGGFVVLVAAGVTFAAVMSSKGTSSSDTNPSFVATTIPPINSQDWTKGDPNAKVSLVEYGDFECPACGAYYPVVNQLVTQYGDRVRFAFRNFPLYNIHPDAGISAQAAEAAGLQGKYWEMFDLLYKNQTVWATTPPEAVVAKYFDGYASSLGLDVKKFDADINGPAVDAKIKADVATANSAQVDHTPTFFVNLKQIPNPLSSNDFKGTLDNALAAAGVSTSTTPASATSSAPKPASTTVPAKH